MTRSAQLHEKMITDLAEVCQLRFYSATVEEQMSEESAWKEIVEIILTNYREAIES